MYDLYEINSIALLSLVQTLVEWVFIIAGLATLVALADTCKAPVEEFEDDEF